MKDRLQSLMSDKNITSARLAGAIGVQPSAISHILSGRNKPGFDFIASLLREFPDINPKWLLLGEEEMYIDVMHKEGYTTPLATMNAKERELSTRSEAHSEEDRLRSQASREREASPELHMSSGARESLITNVIQSNSSVDQTVKSIAKDGGKDSGVERVIIFYKDGSFKEYSNE